MKKTVVGIAFSIGCIIVLPSIIMSQHSDVSANQATIESRLLAIEDQGHKQDALLCSLLEKIHQNNTININLARLQILLEERRNKQIKVDNIMAEIEQLNGQISQEPNLDMSDNQLRQLDLLISTSADPVQRSALIESYNSLKRSAEQEKTQYQQSVEDNRNRLQQLQLTFEDEKAKLDEIENNFVQIDRYIKSVNIEKKTNTCGLR